MTWREFVDLLVGLFRTDTTALGARFHNARRRDEPDQPAGGDE